MTDTPSSVFSSRSHIQTELFRPSLQYSSHSYAEILSKTAERYPENEAVIFKNVNLTYRELDALVNAFANDLKEMIKFKGFSVATAQIEALPAIADVAVIAKPDEEAGEVPKAYVVLRAGYEQLSADELMGWVNDKLATYKNVREIEFIDVIPRNPSGKILRRIVKAQEWQKMG